MNSQHRPVITGSDWMRDVERRLLNQERRPPAASASDLLGPGIGPQAILISDWNNDVVGYNGFFFSDVLARNSPDPVERWIGLSICDTDGAGYQRVTSYRDDAGGTVLFPAAPGVTYVRYFYSPDGAVRTYSGWVPEQTAFYVTPLADTSVIDIVPADASMNIDIHVFSPHELYRVTLDLALVHVGTNSQTLLCELTVDGTAQPQALRFAAGGVAGMILGLSRTWHVTGLSSGIHTFGVTGRLNNLSDTYTIRQGDSAMSIVRAM